MTITEFILARVAEDEKEARAMDEDLRKYPPSTYELAQVPMLDMGVPERVLAECEAKRTIVEQFDGWDGLVYDGWTQAASLVLGEFAAIWADHPDYREEWR